MESVSVAARKARRCALISIAATVVKIGLKSGAYLLTGSVGLLPDAAKSVVNLAEAVLCALTFVACPSAGPLECAAGSRTWIWCL